MDWLLWVKVLHVLAIISWMAGLLYLPRLFVYHAAASPGSDLSETLKVMERRLLRAIMTPAMIVSWLAGLALGYFYGFFDQAWFLVKLLCVVLLSGVHMHLAGCRRQFAADERRHDQRYFRILNEVPTLLMVVIVVMVIVKPF